MQRFIFIVLTLVFCSQFVGANKRVEAQHDTVSYYLSLLDKNPSSAFALAAVAGAYFDKANYDQSAKYSRKCLKIISEYKSKAWLLYALSLDRKGQTTHAISAFQKALKQFPDDAQLHFYMALSYYKLRLYENAIPQLETSIALQPLFVQAHYLYAVCLFESANDKACQQAMLFGLLLDTDSLRSQLAICFLSEYANRRFTKIEIPFFEKRLNICDNNEILQKYFPSKTRADLLEALNVEELSGNIEALLATEKVTNVGVYIHFYSDLQSRGQTKVFANYVLRNINSAYLHQWYKANTHQIIEFADFLEKKLPEK